MRYKLLCVFFLFISGCYTVPETGRSALSFIPDAELKALSLQEFSRLKMTERISRNYEMNNRVERIGHNIARVVGKDIPGAEWEFVVFENDNLINAFALAGGKVGVYTGMLKIATTDDLLATVIGHEIAHVSAKHGNERLSQGLLVELVGSGLESALEDDDSDENKEKTRQAILNAYGLGSMVGYLLPFSRLQENEADHIGVLYAARAGYDPRAAIELWQMMSNKKNYSPPAFLTSHPADQTRINRLKENLPFAMREYEAARARE